MSSAALRVASIERGARTVEPPFMTRIRLRARRRVLWLRWLWDDAARGVHLSISHHEVDRILSEPSDLAAAEQAFYATDPTARALDAEIRVADVATAADPRLAVWRDEFALCAAEVDLLTLTAAIEADPWFRRVFGYIHDDATSALPTPWLASQLFQWPVGTSVGADAALIRWRLAKPVEGQPSPWSVSAGWIADPYVAGCLRGGASIDPRIAHAMRWFTPSQPGATTCLYPEALSDLTSFVRALAQGEGTSGELVIEGARGAGKRTLALQLCDELQLPLLVVDTGRLIGASVDPAAAAEAALLTTRCARLLGSALYWHDSAAAQPGALRSLGPRVSLTIFGCSGRAPDFGGSDDDRARRTLRLPPLTRAVRAAFWSKLSDAPPPAPVLDWPLMPGDMVRVAAIAPAGEDAMSDACRESLPLEASTLALRLPRPYVWDDLVVSPAVRCHLEEYQAQARLRWPVYEEWGFTRLCPLGRGITALFAGPSGTGKTMAAQVLARTLGMEIYRVDLASVMSKYIGETEKHLRALFDACERANVLLFFDEADALFGQRTQVKDAHDRFANIEIDYLLQRMEQFDGIAVLATNRRGDLDSAFVRRIRFIVDFELPSVAERRKLWRLALPERAPDGTELLDAIDWDWLAQRLDLSGAEIKAAALSAAFCARAEDTRIGMTHVLHGARRELTKRGVVVRAGDFEGIS